MSVDIKAMDTTIYEQDFYLWTVQTAKQLEQGKWDEIDLPHLIEEIRDMGSNDKHALLSNLRVVLLHLLKYKYQPAYRGNSWLSSIVEHRQRIEELLEKSPSLKSSLSEFLPKAYSRAMKGAAKETGLPISTFPEEFPFTLEETLDIDFLPD